jgi:hypothetical protein
VGYCPLSFVGLLHTLLVESFLRALHVSYDTANTDG